MADPIGVLGLVGLFSTCLELYHLCLDASSTTEDSALLRSRMFFERERFYNVGRACGLSEATGKSQDDKQTRVLREFLEQDRFRRKGIGEALESIAALLNKAEKLDRKYSPRQDLPESLKDKVR
jgi:hypothetical protein